MKSRIILVYWLVASLLLNPLIYVKITYAQGDEGLTKEELIEGPSDELQLMDEGDWQPDPTAPLADPALTADFMEKVSKKPLLKMPGVDIENLRKNGVDTRVIKLLLYLTKPKDLGGKGHTVKLDRVEKNYSTNKKAKSKETDYEQNPNTKEDPNISAHHDGQAFDITEIDKYQCVTKGWFKSAKSPPQPVKVAWQDKEKGKYGYGDSPSLLGQNMVDISKNIFASALGLALGDNIDLDIDKFNLSDPSLSGIILGLGKARIEQELGMKIPTGGDIKTIASDAGRAILANQTGLPESAFTGKNKQEWQVNLAKAILEKDLFLTGGSLAGENPDDWLVSSGRRMTENTLSLRAGILDSHKANEGLKGLATALVETIANIPGGSWTGNEENKRSLPYPQILDARLGIPAETTNLFITGKMTNDQFLDKIGAHLKSYSYDYFNLGENANEAWGVVGSKDDLVADKENNQNKPTDKYNVVAEIFKGNEAGFKALGASVLGRALGLPQEEIDNLIKAAQGNINVSYSHSPVNVSSGDLVNIFMGDAKSRTNSLVSIAEKQFYSAILPNINTDLYLDFRPKDLEKTYKGDGNIDKLTETLGNKGYETAYDLDFTPAQISRLSAKATDKIYSSIANQINSETSLGNIFAGSPSYQISKDDVAQFFKGNINPLAGKLGGAEFDAAIGGLAGNGYDMLLGNINPETIFANAGLATLAKIVGADISPETVGTPGMVGGTDVRQDILTKIISDNKSYYTPTIISNWLELDSYKANFQLGNLIAAIQDPVANKTNLESLAINLSSQILSAKSGFDSSLFTGLLTSPATSATQIIAAGGNILGAALGIGNDLMKTFTTTINSFDFDKIVKDISATTGISNLKDAEKFVLGDMANGVKAWGMAEFAKEINEGLSNPLAQVAYQTLGKSIFGDESAIDQQVQDVLAKTAKNGGLEQAGITNVAVKLAMQGFSKEANYSVMDAVIIKENSAIEPGFAKTMIEGTDQQRLDSLKHFVTSSSGMSDQVLGGIFGTNVPDGTVDSVIKYAQGGYDFSGLEKTFASQGLNLQSQLFSFGDGMLGFAPGSTGKLYNTYQQYQGMETQFQAGKISAGDFQNMQIALAVIAVDTITGGALTNLTSPIDAALGLPAGSTLQIGVALLTGNPAAVAIIVVGAILGIGKTKCPNLQKLAQQNIETILGEINQFAKSEYQNNGSDPVFPGQILTWGYNDSGRKYLDSVRTIAKDLFGVGGQKERAGYRNTLSPEYIHVGF